MDGLTSKIATAAGLIDHGDFAGAEVLAREVLSVDPQHVAGLHVLAVVLRKKGQPELAVECLQAALRRAGDVGAIYFELGAAQSEAKHPLEALDAFVRAAQLDPQLVEAPLNVGALLDRLDRHRDALPWCQRAVELNPQCTTARLNLGNVLRALGRIDGAIEQLETSVRLDPSQARLHWNLSLAYLLAGRFDQGWREYEWRGSSGEVVLDEYPQPRWQGEPLAGKTILVHGEQGIGDEILFATCLPDLAQLGGTCLVVCDPRLARLLARSLPGVSVHGAARRVDRAPAAVPEPIDYQIAAGSLPGFFRKQLSDFPARERLLMPDLALRQVWLGRFAGLGPGLKVGISWRAGGQPVSRRKRSTTLQQWRDVLAVPGVQFVNLQYGECQDDIARARDELGVTIHDWPDADPLVDLDGFAAKVAGLDLVIAVGNATVHLAGALGVPAWAILPLVPGWRWLMSGDVSPWYASVRLVRQAALDDWEPVFAKVARMLGEMAAARTGDARRTDDTSRTGDTIAGFTGSSRPQSAVSPGRPSPAAQELENLSDAATAVTAAARHFQAGDVELAEQLCNEVLQHAPRNHNALHLLGIIAHQTGRVDLAIRSIRRALSVHNIDATMHANLGAALHDAGQLGKAIASFRCAVALQPRLTEAHARLARALQEADDYGQAIEHYRQALDLDPRQPKLYNGLGTAHLSLRQFEQAAEAYREAIRLKPDYMAAQNNLGQALEELDRWDEAAACYERALAIDAQCVPAICNLAAAQHRLGQPHAAEQGYRRALAIQPINVATLKRLGILLEELGRRDEAIVCYDQALAIQPNLSGAAKLRDALLRAPAGNYGGVPRSTPATQCV